FALRRLTSCKFAHACSPNEGVVVAATGARRTLGRAPYGSVSTEVRIVARAQGLALVDSDVDPADWRDRDSAAIADRVVERAHPGAIVRLHDKIGRAHV